MARRSPIAHGLDRQLEELTRRGYRVVPVSELMELSPFLDLPQSDPRAAAAKQLLDAGWCPAFRDNTLRADTPLTRGALAMMAFGWPGVDTRIALARGEMQSPWPDLKPSHPYAGALVEAEKAGCLKAENGRIRPDEPVTGAEAERFLSAKLGRTPGKLPDQLTHGGLLLSAAEIID